MDLNLVLTVFIFNLVFFVNLAKGKQRLIVGHPFLDSEMEEVHGPERKTNERIAVTFPGTRWCGPGNTAGNYEDLGKFEKTDMCCRDHDHCDNIPAGEEKHGLRNNDWFTRLHCDCDKKFYKCLHNINGTVSNVIGRQYFMLRNRCYKNAFPVVECVEYQTWVLIRRCIKYRFDTTLSKLYQWFDLPLYDIDSYPDSNGDEELYYRQQHQNQQEIITSQNMIS